MLWIFAKLAIRLVAFTAVFWLATRPRKTEERDAEGKPVLKPPRISIQPRWAIPIIGVVFGGLNLLLYWIARPLLDLATFRTFSILMPLIVNALLLWGTTKLVEKRQWMKLSGWFAAVWLAVALTLAHGVLYAALDYLPAKI
jgi:uncharacterized membrane protein YvlD (DUF360 family)